MTIHPTLQTPIDGGPATPPVASTPITATTTNTSTSTTSATTTPLPSSTSVKSRGTTASMNRTTHTLHHSQHSSDMKGFTENNNGDITTSLFAEQIVCHRPLFFGPIVSPTVLQKAQQMIAAAIAEQQLVHHNPNPVLQDLPAAVRNVVGTLRTYGYGLDKYVYESPTMSSTTGSTTSTSTSTATTSYSSSHSNMTATAMSTSLSSSSSSSLIQPPILLKGSSGNSADSYHSDSTLPQGSTTRSQHQQQLKRSGASSNSNSQSKWRGHGTVSTFQPVWGTDVRAERLQKYLSTKNRRVGGSNGDGNSNHHSSSIHHTKNLQRPKIVARVSTAPALLSKSPDRHEPLHSGTPTNLAVERKYKYDDNDDDDEDDDDDDDDDENDDIIEGSANHNEMEDELIMENKDFMANLELNVPDTVDRQSSVNTVSSSSSKTSLVFDITTGTTSTKTIGTNDRSGMSSSNATPAPPTPNEQFTAWLRIGTQQIMDHQDFIKSSKSPSTKTVGTVPAHMSSSRSSTATQKELRISTTTMANIPNLDVTSQSAAATAPTSNTSSVVLTPGTPVVLDQDMFSRWVQAGNDDATPTNTGTLVLDGNGMDSKTTEGTSDQFFGTVVTSATSTTGNSSTNAFDGSTFQRLPTVPVGNTLNDNSNTTNDNTGSDNDSVIDDEQNTQVGANDNLNKAVAMFSDGILPNQSNDIPILEPQSQILLSQVDGSRKRPMTNYELTGGYVPMFGVDDTPLPQLSDLGTYETEEDQHRAMEHKRSQDIIEKFVPPNIFGSVACPNPATGPDDYHSWNSRAVAPPRHNNHNNNNNNTSQHPTSMASIASDPSAVKRTNVAPTSSTTHPHHHQSKSTVSGTSSVAPPPPPTASKTPRTRSGTKNSKELNEKQHGNAASRDRFGWWYEPNEIDEATTTETDSQVAHESDSVKDDETTTDDPSLQLPPLYHSSSKMQILTSLEPTMEALKKENLPLSQMHAATSMVQALPYLSDRPHSHRYLQIDTKQIAFPPLQGEIEPLFCSLAIYNVETISSSNSLMGGKASAVPIPDLQRCGRVTEALQFDHVIDPDVEGRCESALWPYLKSNLLSEGTGADDNTNKLRGTSCGVFPLPSNLNVANLYAVLIIRKVLSDEADLEPYLKPRKTAVDLDKLKQNAERASNRNGSFLIPFAFGVAPLLQVFGSDNPIVALSRAVQIPLFHFSDERQIIDHIMVMLFPRADHKISGVGGPAPVTNGGTAMLVMRNFGYLGLHHVVNHKSSLARHRLVDFSGELQIRRRSTEDPVEKREKRRDSDNFRLKLPPWHPSYVAEPVQHGGRVADHASTSNDVDSASLEASHLYAQELAPLPLMMAPASTFSTGPQAGIGSVRSSYEDIEPFYHTIFSNELICHPRILHNCEPGHYSVKVELREIEWNEPLSAYLAHLPRQGINPCIHNHRRGPFLVKSALTSCTAETGEHHFIDEFKIKLPLDLTPKDPEGTNLMLSLFFTVYRVKTHSKSKWKRGAKMLFGSSLLDSLRNGDETNSSGRVKPVACGFLPIAPQSSLLDDGIHDVRVAYLAQSPPAEFCNMPNHANSLMLVEREINKGGIGNLFNRESAVDEAAVDSRVLENRLNDVESSVQTDDSSTDLQSNDDAFIRGEKNAGASDTEHVSLSVRIVAYSSLHSQNDTLSTFLNQEYDPLSLIFASNKALPASLRLGEKYLLDASIEQLKTRVSHSREDQLLESVMAIADTRQCPIPRPTSHLFRVISLLWRSLICGDGEPDLVWSNPCASTPLRVHTFATILHLVGATSLYLAKNGYTQIDGSGKFSFVYLGRVLALMFDEYKLFGQLALETFDSQYWYSAELNNNNNDGVNEPAKKSPPKGRHVRHTFELPVGYGHLRTLHNPGVSSFTSTAGDLAMLPTDGPVTSTNMPISLEIQNTEQKKDDLANDKPEFKVDSKHDFQTLMRLSAVGDDDHELNLKSSNGNSSKDLGMERPSKALIQAYGGISGVGGRRYMTMPAPLSTILESSDDMPTLSERNDSKGNTQIDTFTGNLGVVDKDVTASKSSSKQMRRPKVVKGVDFDSETNSHLRHMKSSQTTEQIITSDDILASMDAYLDKLSAFEGVTSTTSGHDDNTGVNIRPRAHRRQKTKSASSIDWADNGQVNRSESSNIPSAENREPISSLSKEMSTSIKLPNFAERLSTISKLSHDSGRWFPYAYEVIIMQWSTFLTEQRKSGEKCPFDRTDASISAVEESLNKAAMRAIGVTVASAPMLFEVIKQSLGFRVKYLFDTVLSKQDVRCTPPLVALDDTLMLSLLQIVSMLTDACIDSRNFDSWELRQMSIDVNDAIIRFLRDLFSFLSPECVHRLILTYLSRFLTKEGKKFADRDSLIGLRCSWEITKLRLNAVTAFVRYPDFIKINGPQMLNWDRWWTGIPPNFQIDFFDEILNQYAKYNLPDFVGVDGKVPTDPPVFPTITPHWLSEMVVDICLFGTEHAEQYIQNRSSGLLHELLWSCSQKSILSGIAAPVASMFITIIEKIAANASYISNFSPKSQLRKDVLTSMIFVLQSAPPNLLRALWRRLISRLNRRTEDDIYVSVKSKSGHENGTKEAITENDEKPEPNILSIFSMLNLSLRTLEYEGSDENVEGESSGENRENIEVWRKEFLLSRTLEKRHHSDRGRNVSNTDYSTSHSRQWQSHDGSLVIVNSCHQIILEMNSILHKAFNGRRFSSQLSRNNWDGYRRGVSMQSDSTGKNGSSLFSFSDTVLFVRGVTSVYLQALALRESDITVAKALEFSAKVIEIFGIKIFIEAVGETLQHWMRVISFHCGARRALVRIEATDLLELLLRSTWDCFGSFFRIRVPLLAVQTEVMERIVAISTARYYRDQRRLGTNLENFTNLGAEASLVPLWRSLDRIQKRPASQQIAYKRALIRIAGKLKNLYRAYVAARVLTFLRSNNEKLLDDEHVDAESVDFNPDSRVRALQISILRVINASDGYSKLFLGLQGTAQQRNSIAHYEAVEDALITAANVFSPTELPEHRVAWLRMLADFHHSRKKYAEEASCHYSIHVTLHLAARLHGSLWSNTAFLPWTDNTPNPIVYIDSDFAPAADPDCSSDSNLEDWEICGHPDSSSSFRRIFYRVANSIGYGNNEWESGESKTLFNGISYSSEYDTVSPWMTLREMEEDMVEEIEAAGALFLRAGIVDSSRFSWNIATQHYAEKFNYAKLVIAYSNLARVVTSHVPSIDTSLPQEVTTTLGRFYRVWFHGGAPDDLNGVEFVYRSTARLKEFAEELRGVIMSIIPSKTPINLVFDGVVEETDDNATTLSGYRLGQVPLEPVKIKITPLRPLFDGYVRTRGLPEWFHGYTDEMFSGRPFNSPHTNEQANRDVSKRLDSTRSAPGETHDPHHTQASSFSATLFSSVGSSVVAPAGYNLTSIQSPSELERKSRFTTPSDGDLAGVDKFCFIQPKNRTRPLEWWKSTAAEFAEKSLRVTQLQVAESFPACVSRQVVAHRLVFSQSPLEAGIDSVCQWCSILFQTAVATTGMAVLKTNFDPGIGTDAAKIVADSIHNSRVKEIGLTLLKEPSEHQDRSLGDFTTMDSGRLSDDEIVKLQIKLARLIVVFVELLHLLIGRNRDMLLEVIQDKKKSDNTGPVPPGGMIGKGFVRQTSTGQRSEGLRKAGSVGPFTTTDPSLATTTTTMQHRRNYTDMSVKSEDARGRSLHHFPVGSEDNQSYQSVVTSAGVRTESAIAVQSELQRAFISLTKALYKNVQSKLLDETPRWFKQIGQDSYFSLGTYLQTKIPMAEELCFMGFDGLQSDAGSHHPFTSVPSFHSEQGYDSPRGGSVGGGSQTGSVVSKGSERYGFGQF